AKAGGGGGARAGVDRGGRRRGRVGQAALDGRRAGTASGDGDARREAGGDVLARAGEAVHAAGAPVDPGRVGRGRVGRRRRRGRILPAADCAGRGAGAKERLKARPATHPWLSSNALPPSKAALRLKTGT